MAKKKKKEDLLEPSQDMPFGGDMTSEMIHEDSQMESVQEAKPEEIQGQAKEYQAHSKFSKFKKPQGE